MTSIKRKILHNSTRKSIVLLPSAKISELPKIILRKPTLAIVMPVYRHSVLVADALVGALREAEACNGVVVLVNDGCPFPETHDFCMMAACGSPNLVEYIRTPNGGLSAARNRGIQHALTRFPDIEVFYLLDADNRLSPGALRRARETMDVAQADWIYPNIDKFGLEWSGDFSAPYSVLRHLFQNICEAGSLIHKRVFDAGIFFDESMRQGYEDWEFWLQCAEAGFRGAPCTDFGFQYRARRESMVRNSDRESTGIMTYIHRKHKKLFSWENILLLEHQEAPRFCIYDTWRRGFSFTSVAAKDLPTVGKMDLDQLFWLNDMYPTQIHFPAFIVFVDQRIVTELNRLKLADTVFWHLEDKLEQHAFVFIDFSQSVSDFSLEVLSSQQTSELAAAGPHIVAVRRPTILECSLDPVMDWVNSIKCAYPMPSVGGISIKAPFHRQIINRPDVRKSLQELFSFIHALRSSPYIRGNIPNWEWREREALLPANKMFAEIRSLMNAVGPIARFAGSGHRQIAFILPIMSFGGVEQVGIQLAIQFKKLGWHTRLIITERNQIKALDRLLDVFDMFLFLDDDSYSRWRPSGLKYFGHELQKWPTEGRHERLFGLVAGCSAVVSLQANHGYEAMGWLRRHGIITATSLHLLDRDLLGAPVGHPYLMLGYEHAFDIVTAPSKKLLNFCSAAGVPSEKLVYLPNAPTFTIDKPVKKARLRELHKRANASEFRRLRVLSIGRLDRQKGLERLSALVRAVKENNVPVEWRFVGGQIVDESGDLATDEDIVFEPPVYDRLAIIDKLLWADVVVLLSRWEGSPLLILEAQSIGAIPLATDVGSVSEMIRNGIDGVLLPDGSQSMIVRAAINELNALVNNPSARLLMAQNAMARMDQVTWAENSRDLITKIQSLLESRTNGPAPLGARGGDTAAGAVGEHQEVWGARALGRSVLSWVGDTSAEANQNGR